jgi:hypothetical protein
MFESRLRRKMFRPKKEEVTGEKDFCFSPNIIRVLKSRRMRWAGHVASMGDRRDA